MQLFRCTSAIIPVRSCVDSYLSSPAAITASREGEFLFITFQGGEVYVKTDLRTAVYVHMQKGRTREMSGLCGNANSEQMGEWEYTTSLGLCAQSRMLLLIVLG